MDKVTYRYSVPAGLLRLVLITLILFFETSYCFAATSSMVAGKTLHFLITSNRLWDAYLASNCRQYVSRQGIMNLINLNKKSIADFEKVLSKQDREGFNQLANSPNELASVARLVETYITDTVATQSKEPGGLPYACGVAYGNVKWAFMRARSHAVEALQGN